MSKNGEFLAGGNSNTIYIQRFAALKNYTEVLLGDTLKKWPKAKSFLKKYFKKVNVKNTLAIFHSKNGILVLAIMPDVFLTKKRGSQKRREEHRVSAEEKCLYIKSDVLKSVSYQGKGSIRIDFKSFTPGWSPIDTVTLENIFYKSKMRFTLYC